MEISNREVDTLIEVYKENSKLREENALLNAILETLKAKGFESEIKYVEFKVRNNYKNFKK
ncbi:MAG: hypothetical protein ACOC1K_00545 [Nanoarchaeota archaeon]